MGCHSLEISLENRGTLNFEEIWPESSLVHLIASKIHFYQKRLIILNSTVEEVHVRPNPIPQRLSPRIEHVRSTSRIPERLAGHVQPPTRTCPGL
jgi:hypothetical protein